MAAHPHGGVAEVLAQFADGFEVELWPGVRAPPIGPKCRNSRPPQGLNFTADEQAFLGVLYESASEQGVGIHGFGDEDNLELGYAVCQGPEDWDKD